MGEWHSKKIPNYSAISDPMASRGSSKEASSRRIDQVLVENDDEDEMLYAGFKRSADASECLDCSWNMLAYVLEDERSRKPNARRLIPLELVQEWALVAAHRKDCKLMARTMTL